MNTIKLNKYMLWPLLAAILSGVSIYVNKIGVAQVNDSFVYTTLKNTLVASLFFSLLLFTKSFSEFKSFTWKMWLQWVLLGLIGGGIPFLMFFQGLTMTSAATASFIQKTQVLWVAVLSILFFRERLNGWQVSGLGVLVFGQILLSTFSGFAIGGGELLILGATLLWAIETILARQILSSISPQAGALGRMSVGAVVMWIFLSATGKADMVMSMNSTQFYWVSITSAFLFAYVLTWYKALKYLPATVVTSILTLGSLVTIGLNAMLDHQAVQLPQLLGLLMLLIGGLLFIFSFRSSNSRLTVLS